jgi:GTP-binding protein
MDVQMLEWFSPRGIPVHVLLTKADKLGRSEQAQVLKAARAQLSPFGPAFSASLFSSLKKTGVPEVEEVIARWLGIMPGATSAAAPGAIVSQSASPTNATSQ